MLYLDYDMAPGEWSPNTYGGRENLDAIAFLRKLNQEVLDSFPSALMIAEESTAWDMVTRPVSAGGLGFSFKWNMGWMNDILDYSQSDPIFRQYLHEKLTFSLLYAFNEHFILPISHDEVVHGKKSLLDKFPGNYEQKFAGLRAFLCYMMAHPGKKLMFMGSEFGQFIEWDYKRPLDWFLLDYPAHKMTHDFFKELNHFYLENPALWQDDQSWEGFQWIIPDDASQNVVSFRRIPKKGEEILVVVNFSPVQRDDYRIGVPGSGNYKIVFHSGNPEFVEEGVEEGPVYKAVPGEMHGLPSHISLRLPGLSAIYLKKETERRKKLTI